jgi:O-antigen ligase
MTNKISEGKGFALLIFGCYVLFTLLPDSHSKMVQWSWVLLWQGGILCPIIWWLWLIWQQRRIQPLGKGWDWWAIWVAIAVCFSTIFAQFPSQARWYGIPALSALAALLALHQWLNSQVRRYRLLVAQGYLSFAFILISLTLWTTQTLLPELNRLAAFRQFGVDLPFDFSVLELRNWAPLGHQNYVAGYLLLALPLMVGLAILQTGAWRWLWLTGVGLGLVDLYTTSSRGGWLGLGILCCACLGFLYLRSSLPRLWLGWAGLAMLGILTGLVLANNRLRSLIAAIWQPQAGGEFTYRIINAAIGWQMGSHHPLSGIGLGGVPLLYQKYHPLWAGQEAELAYQLHSTPVQLWAEMGLGGMLALVGAIALLAWGFWRDCFQPGVNHRDRILYLSLYGAFLAYGVLSLTDYQLDNLSITGTLIIYLAALLVPNPQNNAIHQSSPTPQGASLAPLQPPTLFLYGGLGILLASLLWLIPVHRAWQLSAQGFEALNQKDLTTFVERLTKAHQLAPWEPYYPYQLGWNLGNLGLQVNQPQQRQQLLTEGIDWLKKGIAASPYQEFGYSNLGWLLLETNPQAASEAFRKAIELMPAKRKNFYGLGLSWLGQKQLEKAIESFTLEGLRDPLFITSPIWRSPRLKAIYPQVLDSMITHYRELLQQNTTSKSLTTYFHQCRGGLYWWQGNFQAAHKDLDTYGTPLSKLMLTLAEAKPSQTALATLPVSPARLVLQAWNSPAQRLSLLQKAWIEATKTELTLPMQQALLSSLESSPNFQQWLRESSPVWQYRRERSGFGVLSRHIDGPLPSDLFLIVENVPMTNWFAEIFPSFPYFPDLDKTLLKTIKNYFSE